ncbi:MAG: hypothetical protein AB7S48_17065 [Bacteroidales bacterium]
MKKTSQLWVITAVIMLFNLVMYLSGIGGERLLLYVSDLLPVLCAFIAMFYLFRTYRKFKECDFTKISWLLTFVGITLFFFGESTYGFFEIVLGYDMNEAFPGLADYIWCLGYIPLFLGMGLMFYGYKKGGFPMGNTGMYVLISVAIALISITVMVYLLIPIVLDSETDLISKVFYLYYPIGDIFLVIPAVILMYITSLFGRSTISRPWRFLALGYIFFTIADLLYSYLSWEDAYGSGNLIDLAWNFGYLLIALAGLYQMELIKSLNERIEL